MIAEGKRSRGKLTDKRAKGERETMQGQGKVVGGRDAIDLQSCLVVHASVYTNHMHINDHSLVLVVSMAEQNVVIQITWLAVNDWATWMFMFHACIRPFIRCVIGFGRSCNQLAEPR